MNVLVSAKHGLFYRPDLEINYPAVFEGMPESEGDGLLILAFYSNMGVVLNSSQNAFRPNQSFSTWTSFADKSRWKYRKDIAAVTFQTEPEFSHQSTNPTPVLL